MSDPMAVAGTLLDEAPGGFMSIADDGKLKLINATLLDMLGYSREELVGQSINVILPTAGRIFYQTHFFPLVRLHGRAEEIFLLLRGKDGDDIAVLVNAVRRERDGSWLTECLLMRVRERRKFEDALVQARNMAEEARSAAELHQRELERQRSIADEANRTKSIFLANMSHELRTPLNAIGGYVQLLEMGIHGTMTDAQLDALARITRSQRHLLRLINDVLNFARVEAGRLDYDIQPVVLRELLDVVLPMIEPQLAARDLQFRASVQPGIEARADRDKTAQILLNLLSNAVKFVAPGGVITVEIDAGSGDGRRVYLRVRDTGIGIPPARLMQVFEPFVQVDDSPAGRSAGTGLGLAISRDLARGMGGDLSVVSEMGKGSTFTLSLPGV